MAARASSEPGRQEADARSAVRGAAVRRRGWCDDDDRRPRRVEREGQARTSVEPGAPQLAAGVRNVITDRGV